MNNTLLNNYIRLHDASQILSGVNFANVEIIGWVFIPTFIIGSADGEMSNSFSFLEKEFAKSNFANDDILT